MHEEWKINLYRDPRGKSPVKEFIDGVEVKAQTKVRNAINLLKEFGVMTGSPHIKKLKGTELWELRILGTDSIRIFYVTMTGRIFLLLHGFKKKKDKTPQKEIKIALERLSERRSRL